jgi:FkbM family methyltransferase
MSGFFTRAKIASFAFLDIANWREVLPRAAAGETVTEIRLRNGRVITAPMENALWAHFSDVWYHYTYGKRQEIPDGAIVVDIGANVGVFSLFAARRAEVVYALEPASANFSRLVANTSQVQNIVPMRLACGGKEGSATLDLSSNPVSFSLMTQSSGKSEGVEVVTLASLFERLKIKKCDLLKLDCEGAEFEIILDSAPALLRSIPRIVMEYHDYLSQRFSHRDLVARLEGLGFRVRAYNQHETYGIIEAVHG